MRRTITGAGLHGTAAAKFQWRRTALIATTLSQSVESANKTLIERALTRINPVFRTAVVLRDIENLSYEEIADILQVSLGTVKSRILRGREALRREITGRPDPGLSEAMA